MQVDRKMGMCPLQLTSYDKNYVKNSFKNKYGEEWENT